jgi:hypothetical protein
MDMGMMSEPFDFFFGLWRGRRERGARENKAGGYYYGWYCVLCRPPAVKEGIPVERERFIW